MNREILEAALRGLAYERAKIEAQIKEIEGLLHTPVSSAKTAAPPPVKAVAKTSGGKRNMSPEARNRIAEAQRKRWAASRGEVTSAAKDSVAPAKKGGKRAAGAKRTMSAEARARIAEAQRKRWAAKKS